MKQFFTSLLLVGLSAGAFAQTQITNGGFENWGNPSPGNSNEPTSWYSNKSGSNTAQLGGQTCFKDVTVFHTGTSSVRVETISGPFSTVINGNVTTGVVNAPTLTKSDGYIGTANFSDSTTDRRYMPLTARPDSLVGWYQYTSGGAGEQGKVRAILHNGDYFDPETPATYHADYSSHKVADALFLTPASTVGTWTRFSVPFTYVGAGNPAYIMINVTSSANQNTSVTGSKLWLDDLQVVYKPNSVSNVANEDAIKVYSYGKTVFADANDNGINELTISFYDITGRLVATHPLVNNKLNAFDMQDAKAGIYIYRITGNNVRKTGKLSLN